MRARTFRLTAVTANGEDRASRGSRRTPPYAPARRCRELNRGSAAAWLYGPPHEFSDSVEATLRSPRAFAGPRRGSCGLARASAPRTKRTLPGSRLSLPLEATAASSAGLFDFPQCFSPRSPPIAIPSVGFEAAVQLFRLSFCQRNGIRCFGEAVPKLLGELDPLVRSHAAEIQKWLCHGIPSKPSKIEKAKGILPFRARNRLDRPRKNSPTSSGRLHRPAGTTCAVPASRFLPSRFVVGLTP
jgi:hypothetical protein